MEGDDAGGQSAAEPVHDLRHSVQPRLQDQDEPVADDGLHQLNGDDSRDAARLQGRTDADQQIFDILARDDFQGPRYDRFVDELVRYSIPVLRGWMYSGFIFTLLAKRGHALQPHDFERELLASDSDLREELAIMTIACALPRFRQRALIEGGWTPVGGASISTYFIGACTYEFANEFRRWRKGEERHRRALQHLQEHSGDPVSPVRVDDEVLGKMVVQGRLSRIKNTRTRVAVALTIDDCPQDEIREVLDAASVRVVEGLLHRWRTNEQRNWDREEGDEHGEPGRR
ncbi:hypothetical protein ACIQK6_31020 [Streptomyces sp. NPDC091682]|uniref:hypothetical protein n=1 Tax=Streptomyces sp. NPDC091682 TaxID=3366005 RepID=UPI00382DE335